MNEENQLRYFRRRVLEERELAASAACEEAREAHAKLSKLYEARLTLTYVDQANSTVKQNRQMLAQYVQPLGSDWRR
jgi:hypothetical protein